MRRRTFASGRCLTDNGFTLIEVVVVLAIVGVTLAVVLPAIPRSGPDRDALRAAANVVAALLARARVTALELGHPVSVILDPERARYWVVARTTAAEGARGPARLAAPEYAAVAPATRDSLLDEGTLMLPGDVSLAATGPRTRFAFAPTGAASGDTLTIRAGERATIVSVARWTGDVVVGARP